MTTEADESDPEVYEWPFEGPYQGGGLSLREAITLANGSLDRACITFSGPLHIVLGSPLPRIEHIYPPPAGSYPWDFKAMSLVAEDRVVLDGVELQPSLQEPGYGLALLVQRVRGLTFQNFPDIALFAGALWFADQLVVQNVFVNNGTAIYASMYDGTLSAHHNTFNANAAAIEVEPAAEEPFLRNNIFSNHSGAALNFNYSQASDYNLFFQNNQDCLPNACQIGPNSVFADPLYEDISIGNYRLRDGSPAIDAGAAFGLDVNGAEEGLFNGLGPDIGAFESE